MKLKTLVRIKDSTLGGVLALLFMLISAGIIGTLTGEDLREQISQSSLGHRLFILSLVISLGLTWSAISLGLTWSAIIFKTSKGE